MDDKKRLAISGFALVAVFLFTGAIFFSKAEVSEEQVNGFLDSLGNEKSLNYFSKFRNVLSNYDCMKLEVIGKYGQGRFYLLNNGTTQKTVYCDEKIKIRLRTEAIARLIYGSYNINGAIFSEFISGNIAVEGLKLSDMVKLV